MPLQPYPTDLPAWVIGARLISGYHWTHPSEMIVNILGFQCFEISSCAKLLRNIAQCKICFGICLLERLGGQELKTYSLSTTTDSKLLVFLINSHAVALVPQSIVCSVSVDVSWWIYCLAFVESLIEGKGS